MRTDMKNLKAPRQRILPLLCRWVNWGSESLKGVSRFDARNSGICLWLLEGCDVSGGVLCQAQLLWPTARIRKLWVYRPRVDLTTQVSNLLTASGLACYHPSSARPHPGDLLKLKSDCAAPLHEMPLAPQCPRDSSLASCSGLPLRYLWPLPFLFLGILCPHRFWSDLLKLLPPSPQRFLLSHPCTSIFDFFSCF